MPFGILERPATERGMRTIAYSRPGHEQRQVALTVEEVGALGDVRREPLGVAKGTMRSSLPGPDG